MDLELACAGRWSVASVRRQIYEGVKIWLEGGINCQFPLKKAWGQHLDCAALK